MKRPLVLLLLALVVAITGALAVWLVLGGAQQGAMQAGPSEINEIPLYAGAVNVEKNGAHPDNFAHLRYEVDAAIAAVDAFYSEELSASDWLSDWVTYRRVGGDSVNLDWQAPKYDDTIRRHFYRLGEQGGRPYDVSVILEVSDNRGSRSGHGPTGVWISLVRVPHLDEVPVMSGATEVERAGHLTTYRTTATVDELTDYYTGILPEHGWTYRGPMTDPLSGQDLPGSMLFGYVSHGLGAYLQIKAAAAADGKLNVHMRARGSEITPED